MRTNLTIFLIVALLISGVVIYLQYRSAELAQRDRNLEAKEFRNQAKESLSKIEARDGQIKALLNDRAEDSVRHAKTQSGLKAKIAAIKSKYNIRRLDEISEAKWELPTLNLMDYDSIVNDFGYKDGKIVTKFLHAEWRDTVIYLQENLISDLEQERDTLYLTDNQVIDSLRRQVSDVSELFKGQLMESIRLQNQVDREKRKRFSIGPHVGAGLRGADVGISLQYSLWRF